MDNEYELVALAQEENEAAVNLIYRNYESIIKYKSNRAMCLLRHHGVELSDIMQEGYIASTPENGLVKLTFLEVDSYDCLTGNLDSYSILRVTYQDNNTFISILDDFNNDYYPIKIPSDKVIFQTI